MTKKKAKPIFPPRSNASLWEDGHARSEAIERLKAGALKEWKEEAGYHKRSLSKTAIYRYKQLVSSKLSLRDSNGQVDQALTGVWALYKTCALGMPDRQKENKLDKIGKGLLPLSL